MTGERPEPTFLITSRSGKTPSKPSSARLLFFDQQSKRRSNGPLRADELTGDWRPSPQGELSSVNRGSSSTVWHTMLTDKQEGRPHGRFIDIRSCGW